MAALEISPTKIGYVIVKARECAAKVAAWDDGATSDHDADSILDSFSDDATRERAQGFHPRSERGRAGRPRGARLDRQRLLRPEELDEALETARSRACQPHRGISPRHAHACRLSRGRVGAARLFGRGRRGRLL